MEKAHSVENLIPQKSRRQALLWVMLAVLMTVLFLSHTYNDIVITTRQGINFWSILKNGDFFRFYEQNICQSGNLYYSKEQSCAYNILVYIVFAIWNLPLALLMKFTEVDVMNNVACLAWSKLLVVAALMITAYITHRIMQAIRLPNRSCKLGVYMYLSSAIVLGGVFISAQYDVLALIFILLGVLAYVENRDRDFLLFFSVALCFKYFALLIFLPLLLLRQKRVWLLAKDLLLLLLPCVATSVPFMFSDRPSLVMEILGILFEKDAGGFNWFIVIYGGLLVWCFYVSPADHEELNNDALWACFVSMASFVALCSINPYWSVLLAPFAAILIVREPKDEEISVLLETVASSTIVLCYIAVFWWCYIGDTMKPMILGYLFPDIFLSAQSHRIVDILINIGNNFSILLKSPFVIGMAALAVIHYPGRKRNEDAPTKKVQTSILYLRFAIIAAVSLLPIISQLF